MTLDTLTPDEIPDRPQVDRWSPSDFEHHCAAEGVELHASRRFGGPPSLSLCVLVSTATAALQAIDESDDIEL